MLLRNAIADLMTETLETADETTNVSEVAKDMSKKNIGAVVVLSPLKDPVGIFTERDLLRRVVAPGMDPKETPVSKVMTSKLICADVDDDIEDLAEMMVKQNFRHLPVKDGSKIVGMLSLKDLVKHLTGMP